MRPLATASAAAGVPTAPTIAPKVAAPESVAEQIGAYLKSSPVMALPRDTAPDVTSSAEPRKAHGELSVAVGSGGYHSAYVRSDMPVGKTATLSIAIKDSQFNGRRGGYGSPYGGPYGRSGSVGRQSLGLGLSFGGGQSDAQGLRCRATVDSDRPYADTPERRACLHDREVAQPSTR